METQDYSVSDSRIPMQYRTRGQRYDDLLASGAPEKKSAWSKLWDRLERFLWGDNRFLDGLAKLICLGVMGYFIGSVVRAIF